jgi:hypothetical protein
VAETLQGNDAAESFNGLGNCSAGSFAAALVFILLSAVFAASYNTIFYSAKHVG